MLSAAVLSTNRQEVRIEAHHEYLGEPPQESVNYFNQRHPPYRILHAGLESTMSCSDVPMSSRHTRSMPPPIRRPEGKLTFVGLPLEIQQQIVGHVNPWILQLVVSLTYLQMSRKDLFIFQRLSLESFSLANAQIYRNLDLNLSNSSEGDNGLPSTHAADTLHNILASDHDYGKHIKSIRLGATDDTIELPGGHIGRSDSFLMTRFCWDSKSDSSKLLNTALLLVARKTSKLEAFLSVPHIFVYLLDADIF